MIINTYDQMREAVRQGIIPEAQAVWLTYIPYTARMSGGSKWYVRGLTFKTDPKAQGRHAHWSDNGDKSFLVYNKPWQEVLVEVKEWCYEKYGITKWSRNRMRDYVPSIVNQKLPIPKNEGRK